MPNLDELSHDMSFTIGGEVFHIHDVPPSVLQSWDDEPEDSKGDVLASMDKHIIAFLNGDADAVTRYKNLRARKANENPVPAWKVVEFHNLLVETQTRRPTEVPSPSVPGRGPTAPTSGGA